jgi:hypothetical protein
MHRSKAYARAISTFSSGIHMGSMNNPYKKDHRTNIYYQPRTEEMHYEN